jgi:hypothetical protein
MMSIHEMCGRTERERGSEEVDERRDGEGRKSGNKRLLVEREAERSP